MNPIVIAAPVRTAKGKGDELVKLFCELVPLVRKEKGTLTYTINRQLDDPDRFLVYEKYIDQEAINYHASTPYFKEFSKKAVPLLVAPVSIEGIRIFQEII